MGYHDAHLPCDDCGSSDALQKNENGSSYCHSCGVYSKPTNGDFVIEVPYNAEAEAAPMEPMLFQGTILHLPLCLVSYGRVYVEVL